MLRTEKGPGLDFDEGILRRGDVGRFCEVEGICANRIGDIDADCYGELSWGMFTPFLQF